MLFYYDKKLILNETPYLMLLCMTHSVLLWIYIHVTSDDASLGLVICNCLTYTTARRGVVYDLSSTSFCLLLRKAGHSLRKCPVFPHIKHWLVLRASCHLRRHVIWVPSWTNSNTSLRVFPSCCIWLNNSCIWISAWTRHFTFNHTPNCMIATA